MSQVSIERHRELYGGHMQHLLEIGAIKSPL